MEYIKVGKITNTHALKGELKVTSDSENFEYFLEERVPLVINNINYLLAKVRYNKNQILIFLEGYKDINDVEFLKGSEILVSREFLDEEESLVHDLFEMKVMEGDVLLGKVIDVLEGKQNTLVVKAKNGDVTIPLVDEFVKNIDNETRIIKVELIKGMKNED